MASETGTEVNEPYWLERLISSRNRDLSLFIPIILGLRDSGDPDQETPPDSTTQNSRGRIILINPLTQGMVVIEGSSSRLDSLLRDLMSKDGQPPASRASIEAMPTVEISGEDEEGECVICLEEWVVGGEAKQMPCNHRFHWECIEKWLGIHGSCPVCRFKMPVEEDDDDVIKKSGTGGDERERMRREIWVNFSLSRNSSGESNQTPTGESNDSSSPPGPDHQLEG